MAFTLIIAEQMGKFSGILSLFPTEVRQLQYSNEDPRYSNLLLMLKDSGHSVHLQNVREALQSRSWPLLAAPLQVCGFRKSGL